MLKVAVSKRESQELNLGHLVLNYCLPLLELYLFKGCFLFFFVLFFKVLSTTVSHGALEMSFCCHETFFFKIY